MSTEKLSVEEALSKYKITPEQASAGYNEFRALVNKPIPAYVHTDANCSFLFDKVMETAGVEALIFGGSYLEAFHTYGDQLPNPFKTEAELVLERQKKEIERTAELETRDRYAGRDPGHRSEAQLATDAEEWQRTFEETKNALKKRVEEIRNYQPASTSAPTLGDALASLKATGFTRAAVRKWLLTTDTSLVLEIRRRDGMAAKIDGAVRGDNG